MKERPILFSAPMVRAILAGTKTQTRRPWPVQPPPGVQVGWVPGRTGAGRYGKPGDRLWVRETFRFLDTFDEMSPREVEDRCLAAGYSKPWAPVRYEVDGATANWQNVGTPPHSGGPRAGKTRVSIHMPRWASRITLEITDVRVERLQAISEADATAEGTPNSLHLPGGRFATENFAHLWETINGEDSWAANPWVWAITFRRITP